MRPPRASPHVLMLRLWPSCPPPLPQTPITGWLEAFAAHPRLGDRRGLAQRSGAFSDLSRDEQSSAAGAAEATLAALTDWNARYEARFGHIFIACAAGTPADRMLAMVKQR